MTADPVPEAMVELQLQTVFPDESYLEAAAAVLERDNADYQAALQHIGGLKLQASPDPGNRFGWSTVSQSPTGDHVRALTIVQDLSGGPRGQDVALVSVTVRGDRPDQELTQVYLVEKPAQVGPAGFNLEDATVTVFQGGQAMAGAAGVVPAAGTFWQRFVTCVRGSCGSVCLAALPTCAGTWVLYLKCLAVVCGGCVLKCSACAACDCSWWCRWAAGCCKP